MSNGMAPESIKHLEMIQSIISRLSNGSFVIKGWAMTVASAILGLAATKGDLGISIVGILPIAGFWLLDAFFLRQERLFRSLYDDVRSGGSVDPFSMDVSRYSISQLDSIKSPTLLFFYAVPAAALLLIFLIAEVSR